MMNVTTGKKASEASREAAQNEIVTRPFVEYPTQPLSNMDRDNFLALLESDDEPNAALRVAAEEFKHRFSAK
jgi:hypothetical protein